MEVDKYKEKLKAFILKKTKQGS